MYWHIRGIIPSIVKFISGLKELVMMRRKIHSLFWRLPYCLIIPWVLPLYCDPIQAPVVIPWPGTQLVWSWHHMSHAWWILGVMGRCLSQPSWPMQPTYGAACHAPEDIEWPMLEPLQGGASIPPCPLCEKINRWEEQEVRYHPSIRPFRVHERIGQWAIFTDVDILGMLL